MNRFLRAFQWYRPSWSPGTFLALTVLLAMAAPAHSHAGLRGDANNDKKITTADAILVLRGSVGLIKLDATQKLLADANNDGRVNTSDAILILRRAVGLIKDLGVVELPSEKSTVQTSIVNNETVFEWPKTGKGFGVAIFKQGSKEVTFAANLETTSDKDRLRLKKTINRRVDEARNGNDYTRFEGFVSDQPVSVELMVGDSSSSVAFTPVGKIEFMPTIHRWDPEVYGEVDPEVTLDAPLPSTAKVGDLITVAGKAVIEWGLRSDAFYVPPSGFPVELPLISSVAYDPGDSYGPRINAGNDFRMSFKIEEEGYYRVEINNYLGSAAVNWPIYVGNRVPFLPGPRDFQGVLDPNKPLDLAATRKEWLELLNDDREMFGLPPLEMDETLNAAAQAHAEDMVKNNYFGHIGMDGSDPTSRANRVGFPLGSLVAENLTQAVRVTGLESGLMGSAVHRETILGNEWKKVGLGIFKHPSGLLFGVQEFGVEAGEYKLPTDTYSKVILDEPLPTAFFTGDTVKISGTVDPQVKSVLVFFINTETQEQVLFPRFPIAPKDGHFSIDVNFEATQTGIYYMGISVDGGVSEAPIIVVKPGLALPPLPPL